MTLPADKSALLRKSKVCAWALGDVTTGEVELFYLHEDPIKEIEASAKAGKRSLGLIGLTGSGLQVLPESDLTAEQSGLLLKARSEFLLGCAALHAGGMRN